MGLTPEERAELEGLVERMAVRASERKLAAVGLLRAYEMGGWRPIETAPKDGTEILLWGPKIEGHDGTHYVARWDPRDQAWETGYRKWACFCDGATHWMPLPEGPDVGEK